jgi:tetratricopeptide (TPR) repeat protein
MLSLELAPPQARPHAPAGGAYDLYLRGRGYLQNYDEPENIESAIGEFNRALQLDPVYAPAYAGLGQAYWKKFENSKQATVIDTARQNCERAEKLDARLSAARICLGTIYTGTGMYEQAAQAFQRGLEIEPTSDEAYRGLAKAYERLGRVADAEKTYRRAIELRPHYWAGYSWLGAFYARKARYEEAAAQFRQAASQAPETALPYASLGGVYIFMGKYPDAVGALEKANALRPTFGGYSNLGQAYFRQRRFEESVNAFEQALRIDNTDYRAYGNLADAYYWTPGKHDLATGMYRRAIDLGLKQLKVNPGDTEARIMLAQYYAMLKRKAEAFASLRAGLAAKPEDPEYLFVAAVVHNQFGNREAALQWIEKAVARGYSLAEITSAAEFDDLRNDPQFATVVRPR